MAGAEGGSLYSIDSSSLMDWQARYYPTDVFPGLVTRIDTLINDGRLVAPTIVREEVEVVGTTALAAWMKERAGIFIPTAKVLVEAQSIQSKFAGLVDPKAEYEDADAYVIALARMKNGIVVTQETPAAEKKNPKRSHYIPDVCRELGISCISLLGLMRRERWTFA